LVHYHNVICWYTASEKARVIGGKVSHHVGSTRAYYNATYEPKRRLQLKTYIVIVWGFCCCNYL